MWVYTHIHTPPSKYNTMYTYEGKKHTGVLDVLITS